MENSTISPEVSREPSAELIELAAARLRIQELESMNIELVRERDEWREKAERDPTTGLLSREGLKNALENVNLSSVSVVYIDLDNFKRVNDEYGHNKGDEVLTSIAAILVGSTRDGDVISRVGGDEFVVFAPHGTKDGNKPLTPEEQRDALCGRINKAVNSYLESDDKLHVVGFGASVGAVLGRPGADPYDLIDEADSLMYRHKKDKSTKQ